MNEECLWDLFHPFKHGRGRNLSGRAETSGLKGKESNTLNSHIQHYRNCLCSTQAFFNARSQNKSSWLKQRVDLCVSAPEVCAGVKVPHSWANWWFNHHRQPCSQQQLWHRLLRGLSIQPRQVNRHINLWNLFCVSLHNLLFYGSSNQQKDRGSHEGTFSTEHDYPLSYCTYETNVSFTMY